jgi:hypothetical protein
MIAVSVFHLACTRQGGVYMSSCPSERPMQVTSVQVWPALSSDLRTRIVGLLAQLALNVVVVRSENICTTKEVACAQPTTSAKNPS